MRLQWTPSVLLLALLGAGIQQASPAGAGECADYADHVLPLDTFYSPGDAYDLRVRGTIGYALTLRSITVYDLSPAGHPALVGSAPLPRGGASDWLEIGETLAFVGGWSGPLVVVDLDDPLGPSWASELALGGSPARGAAQSGDFAFVAAGYGGLAVVDVSSPASPALLTMTPTADSAEGVVVLGDLAFVAARSAGVLVFDIASPASPVLAGSLPVPASEWAWRVAAGPPGTLVVATYLSTGSGGTVLLADVSARAHAAWIGSAPLGARPQRLAVRDGRAFVGMGYTAPSLHVLDLEGPGAPVTRFVLELGGSTVGVAPLEAGEVVLSSLGIGSAGARGALRRIAVRDGALAPPLASNRVEEWFLAQDGDFVLTHAAAMLSVRDVRSPSLPLVGTTPLSYALRAAAESGLAAVWTGSDIPVVDFRTPGSPSIVATLAERPGVRALGVHDGHVYVSASDVDEYGDPIGAPRQRIVDVRDPAHPTVAYEDTTSSWGPLAFCGPAAYVGGGTRLRVLDISDPGDPRLVIEHDLDGLSVIHCDARGDRLGLVLGLAARAAPFELLVLDVTVPLAPFEVGRTELPVSPFPHPSVHALALGEGVAYVCAGGLGLVVLDTAPPGPAHVIGLVPAAGLQATSVFVGPEHAFVARMDDGRYAAAGTTPHPCRPRPGPAGPRPPPLLAVFPNPFRSDTTIDLGRAATAGTRLDIFDVTGRHVADLGPLAAGGRTARWDGTDRSGRPVAAGVYFLRREETDGAWSRRVVRIR